MSTFQFIPYMRNLAEKSVLIQHSETNKHFHRAMSLKGMEEFLQGLNQNSGIQLIAIAKDSGALDDQSLSDNLIDRQFYTFFVMKQVRHNDFNALESINAECMTVTKKLLSRMFRDKRNSLNGLKDLERGSIHYDTVGPVATGYFGLMVSFALYNPAGISYSQDDWSDG